MAARKASDNSEDVMGAYCDNCEAVFSYEARDRFDGEIYCPFCVSRVRRSSRERSLKEALRKHPNHSRVYTD